jgi:hypothetical protein
MFWHSGPFVVLMSSHLFCQSQNCQAEVIDFSIHLRGRFLGPVSFGTATDALFGVLLGVSSAGLGTGTFGAAFALELFEGGGRLALTALGAMLLTGVLI